MRALTSLRTRARRQRLVGGKTNDLSRRTSSSRRTGRPNFDIAPIIFLGGPIGGELSQTGPASWVAPQESAEDRIPRANQAGSEMLGTPFQPDTQKTVSERGPWAPITSDCSMSAVFEGPEMNAPKLEVPTAIRA